MITTEPEEITPQLLGLYLKQAAIITYKDGQCPEGFEDGTWWINGEIIQHLGSGFIKDIKLVLRKLTSMTIEEARILLKAMETDDTSIRLLEKTMHTGEDGKSWARFSYWFKHYGQTQPEQTIVMNITDNLHNGVNVIRGNQYYRCYVKVIPYLLSCGFDIFGLIDSGLAIDEASYNK